MPHQRWLLVVAALLAAPHPAARADFGTVANSTVREKVIGQVVASDGAPVPEAGDQIGAFVGSTLCGVFTFSSTGGAAVTRDFTIAINGDVPGTSAKEGPAINEKVTFKFFDSSTSNTLAMTVLNTAGEASTYKFNGQTVIDLPGVPIDLTPSVNFNLRVGASDGNGNGNGGGSQTNKYDTDGDGKVTPKDAALILRAVTGGTASAPSLKTASSSTAQSSSSGSGTTQQSSSTAAAATTASPLDVNGDGKVDVNDAIEVMRNRDR